MRSIDIEEMDFIAGGYDYGVDYTAATNGPADDSATSEMQQVIVTGTSMTWYEKLVYDISAFFGSGPSPAQQAISDLDQIRAANPDCSVTQTITIENGSASSTFGIHDANVTIEDNKSGETFTVKCPPLNQH